MKHSYIILLYVTSHLICVDIIISKSDSKHSKTVEECEELTSQSRWGLGIGDCFFTIITNKNLVCLGLFNTV